jgi:Ku70/Ku80 beta-barrel domain
MAPRPFWRGYLKLSLVTCPVALLPATSEAEKVRFHTLNRATGNRVHARYVDGETGKPVDDEDQIKGYEHEDGEYVMLEDEELQAVALESTRTIDIDCFVRYRLLCGGRFDRLDLVRHAALPDPRGQDRRGGVLGHPRSHGEIRHARNLARGAESPRARRAARAARQGHRAVDVPLRQTIFR